MFIFILAVCNFTVNEDTFFETLISSYTIMFGNNPVKLWTSNAPDIALYIIGTCLIVIMSLNILISVVTDNYDNVR